MSARESAEYRRHQLIEATIDVLAQKGYSNLTVGDVAKVARVSHGSVFVHFPSKDELMKATLVSLEDRYNICMAEALAAAKGDPRKIIMAMVETDLSPVLATPRMVRAWASLRSEAREVYESIALTNDKRDFKTMSKAIMALGYPDAKLRAMVLRATLDGLLRQLLLGRTDLDDASKLALASLGIILPQNFGPVKGTAERKRT